MLPRIPPAARVPACLPVARHAPSHPPMPGKGPRCPQSCLPGGHPGLLWFVPESARSRRWVQRRVLSPCPAPVATIRAERARRQSYRAFAIRPLALRGSGNSANSRPRMPGHWPHLSGVYPSGASADCMPLSPGSFRADRLLASYSLARGGPGVLPLPLGLTTDSGATAPPTAATGTDDGFGHRAYESTTEKQARAVMGLVGRWG